MATALTDGKSAENPVLLDDESETDKVDPLSEEILQYKDIGKTTRAIITKRDLLRLAPDCFLNDSLIDFYANYLVDSISHSAERSKFYVCSSFFFQMAKIWEQTEKSQENQNWAKKRFILDKKFIIIPVNNDYHWSLCIIANLSSAVNNAKSPAAVMYHIDSLKGSHCRKQIATTLRKYFSALVRQTQPAINLETQFSLTAKALPVISVSVQQQKNFCDCGLFLLKYVSAFIKNSILNTGNILIKSLSINAEEIGQLRGEIYNLVFQLSCAKNFVSYNEFKEIHRNHFNEHTMRGKSVSKRARPKKVKLSLRNIRQIHCVRDACLVQKNFEPMIGGSPEEFYYSVVVSSEGSETRYSLMASFEQAQKMKADKMIYEFFNSKRWRCQACLKPNSFNSNFCGHCLSKKVNLETIVSAMKQSGKYQLNKALEAFFVKEDV